MGARRSWRGASEGLAVGSMVGRAVVDEGTAGVVGDELWVGWSVGFVEGPPSLSGSRWRLAIRTP